MFRDHHRGLSEEEEGNKKKNAGGTETAIFLEHKKNQIHCISQEELQ